MASEPITHDRLVERMEYIADSGELRYRDTNRRAGSVDRRDGRIRVRIDGARIHIGRLCWFYAHKTWPTGVIDHINGDPQDNRLANLRDIPQLLNAQNRRRACRNSKVGLLGVSPASATTYRIGVHFMGRDIKVGPFHDATEAHQFYLELKRRLHDGCTL